ncbi:MAG: bifunctional hydroxymethylpyrimidine kinase/phosphomethylpyrimidine kinase [Verrucomicrobiales bacterium]
MTIPCALTIAGSDNSAGAGLQADLKAFAAQRVYGLSAVTCVVAETPGLVKSVFPLDPELLREQIELSLQAFPVSCLKTGMLYNRQLMQATLDSLKAIGRELKIVVDPVMVASSGDPLLEPDAVEFYQNAIFPIATLVTPNRDEAQVLWGRTIQDFAELEAAARALTARFQVPFLVKGGHLGGPHARDILAMPDGLVRDYSAPMVPDVSPHGTGCTFSAAITAQLAHGRDLSDAVQLAKAYISAAVEQHHSWESAMGATVCLNHFPELPSSQ